MQISPFHAMYYSKKLQSYRWGDGNLLPAFAMSANMEIYPHQIEAALFTLRSTRQKGVILADETSLGKSEEALIIIAQKWYESSVFSPTAEIGLESCVEASHDSITPTRPLHAAPQQRILLIGSFIYCTNGKMNLRKNYCCRIYHLKIILHLKTI